MHFLKYVGKIIQQNFQSSINQNVLHKRTNYKNGRCTFCCYTNNVVFLIHLLSFLTEKSHYKRKSFIYNQIYASDKFLNIFIHICKNSPQILLKKKKTRKTFL